MKIILLQDEKKLGKKGDIIEASEGYARNYILPKKIGVEATSKNMNDLKLQKANEEKEKRHGKNVFWVNNRQINYTNVCVLHCSFCSFDTFSGQKLNLKLLFFLIIPRLFQ